MKIILYCRLCSVLISKMIALENKIQIIWHIRISGSFSTQFNPAMKRLFCAKKYHVIFIRFFSVRMSNETFVFFRMLQKALYNGPKHIISRCMIIRSSNVVDSISHHFGHVIIFHFIHSWRKVGRILAKSYRCYRNLWLKCENLGRKKRQRR